MSITVAAGQVWREVSNNGRYVRVVDLDFRYAYVERVSSGDRWRTVFKSGRRSRIMLDGLKQSYRLVAEDVELCDPAS